MVKVVLVVCGLILLAVPIMASNQAWVLTSTDTARVGEEFGIWAFIDAEEVIYTAGYTISSPEGLVLFESQDHSNSVLPIVGALTPTHGEIGVVRPGFTGIGQLAWFKAKAIQPGIASINLIDFMALTGPDAHQVPFEVGPAATVTILPVPEPSTLLGLTTGMFPLLFAIRKRR